MDAARFTLPAARLADAQALVARFARKATKLQLVAPAIAVVREFTRFWVVNGHGGVKAGPFDGALPGVYLADRVNVVAADFVDVDVTGTRPVIAGWRFAAVIEATPVGNILRKSPAFTGDLPERFRTCDSACDHCKTHRDRAQTFVVQSVTTDEWKQVGRTCLQDFTGTADASAWMAAFTFTQAMESLSSDGEGGYGYARPYVDVPVFLACVAAHVREVGYMSAKAAETSFPPKMPTGREVFYGLTDKDPAVRRIYLDAVTDDDRMLARDAVAWVNSDAVGDVSDYIHNVRVHAGLDAVDSKGANTLASLLPSYRRHLGATAAKTEKRNEYLPGATVKTRLRDLTLTLVAEHSFDTAFGTKWVMRFEDAQGRTVIWKTTNPGSGYKTGDRVLVTGTVKDLGEYKGTLQTELTRCKVSKIESSAAA